MALVKSIEIYEVMASNDFSLNSSSDSEVSEVEDYELEVEGSPNLSDHTEKVMPIKKCNSPMPTSC